ncbi:MAG: outer membrane beta-barrel protein [Rickettsiella sp.]|nr:outer membrane beta-barrel protein [Rickettsiella sp.]
MLKKIITTGLLSVSALAIITANAAPLDNNNTSNTPKNHKRHNYTVHKKQIAPAKVSDDENEGDDNKNNNQTNQTNENLQTASFERSNSGLLAGFYVNGQVGYADTHMNSKLPAEIGSGLSNNGLAGRLALGYQFNQNYAVEVGYLQLPEGKFNQSDVITLYNKQSAIDIAGKASLPITHNVNLYGKLGVAYLTTKLDEKYDDHVTTDKTNLNDTYGIARHQWAPEAVVGMGYDVTPNVTVDTSFTHIHPMGSDRAGGINFLAVGLGYTFG